MSLTERINNDLKAAMKAGDRLRLETIRMLRAQILEFEKRGLGRPISADDELSILMSASKKRKESIAEYRNAGRADLAEKEERELSIISEYLPQQVSREEAEDIVRKVIADAGPVTPRDSGRIIQLAMKELRGKFDGKEISEIVKHQLGA